MIRRLLARWGYHYLPPHYVALLGHIVTSDQCLVIRTVDSDGCESFTVLSSRLLTDEEWLATVGIRS